MSLKAFSMLDSRQLSPQRLHAIGNLFSIEYANGGLFTFWFLTPATAQLQRRCKARRRRNPTQRFNELISCNKMYGFCLRATPVHSFDGSTSGYRISHRVCVQRRCELHKPLDACFHHGALGAVVRFATAPSSSQE